MAPKIDAACTQERKHLLARLQRRSECSAVADHVRLRATVDALCEHASVRDEVDQQPPTHV